MLQKPKKSVIVVSVSSASWRGAMIEADQATDPAAKENKDTGNTEADSAVVLEAGQSSLPFTTSMKKDSFALKKTCFRMNE